jgi:hypothetical protein
MIDLDVLSEVPCYALTQSFLLTVAESVHVIALGC